MSVDPDSPRYARQRVLPGFGPEAQRRLAQSHVLVVGAGGLGCTVLPALVGAGVGQVTVMDDDTVDLGNLHRQTLYTPADVGRPKAEAAADALTRLSPDTTITALPERFAPGGTFELLLDVDLVVDATDDPGTRYLANDAAAIRGIPMVWGSALAYDGQVGVAWDEKGVDYRDLFPQSPGSQSPGSGSPDAVAADCATAGILPSVCAVIGGMMATEVLKLLGGVGEPLLGRAAGYDARTGRIREISYRRDPAAPRPGSIEERTTPPAERPDRNVGPRDLAAELQGARPPRLLDVREPWEAAQAMLPGAELIPLTDLAAQVAEFDRDTPLVVYCHHGVRSARALEILEKAGITDVRHLTGGIDAWSAKVDPSIPRY